MACEPMVCESVKGSDSGGFSSTCMVSSRVCDSRVCDAMQCGGLCSSYISFLARIYSLSVFCVGGYGPVRSCIGQAAPVKAPFPVSVQSLKSMPVMTTVGPHLRRPECPSGV